jgi:hypothetical protein
MATERERDAGEGPLPSEQPVPSGSREASAAEERLEERDERRSLPTVAAPQGSVTGRGGLPNSEAPPPRQTPLIDAPSDLAIPMRTSRPLDGTPLDVRTAFLLCHVDGRSTIGEIACFVERPIKEVASAFGLLAAMGAVELVGNIAAPLPPSGLRMEKLDKLDKHESGVRPAIATRAAPVDEAKKSGEKG